MPLTNIRQRILDRLRPVLLDPDTRAEIIATRDKEKKGSKGRAHRTFLLEQTQEEFDAQ